jgi:Protein of unknown function (DUF1570)
MNDVSGPISRRNWLLGTLALSALGAGPQQEKAALDEIRAKGKKAGMEGFDESESAHYVGIGDSSKGFREEALKLCETIATEYRKHFGERGFQLEMPKKKLVVVVLRGPKSYVMFEGGFIDEAIGGHFDLETNRLVIFDFAGPGANPKDPVPEQNNTLQLVHETIHQLTFNTGMLDLKADVPLCISEGLATYAETWRRDRRLGVIGAENKRRLLGLKQGLEEGAAWIPLKTLLEDDKVFNDPKTVQVAYAESWMFVYTMLKQPARLAKFRAYLAALRDKPDPSRRIEVATTHLGDLDKLDKELRGGR